MAAALATTSSRFLSPNPNLPHLGSRRPSFSQSARSHSVIRSLHHRCGLKPRNPALSICRGKHSSSREVSERINEAFIKEEEEDGEFVMEDYEDGDGDDEDDDAESSLNLLFKFLQSLFKKVSKRARKASRSVLPDVISPQLVDEPKRGTYKLSFAVDGVLLLASLSVVKALLEVVCTLGGTVFVAILLLRLIWAAIAFFQSNGSNFNQSGNSYNKTQPAT